MRRSYRLAKKPEKDFIHTYHVNEVPLPYYNPLEDPHLMGYFSNRKISRHIQNKGLIYSPKKQYPYQERRTKNAYKFHKDNSVDIPSTHIVKNRNFNKSYMARSQMDPEIFDDEPCSPILKKRAESEILKKKFVRPPFLNEIMLQRPFANKRERVAFSSDARTRSSIFQIKKCSNVKQKQDPQKMI